MNQKEHDVDILVNHQSHLPKNAKLIILNHSDHRMSSSLDLNLLEQTIKNMIKSNP